MEIVVCLSGGITTRTPWKNELTSLSYETTSTISYDVIYALDLTL
jgi:hypothetical protein